MSTNLTTHPTYPVSSLTVDDVIADLALIIDASEADVDGITATADPACADSHQGSGRGDMVVTFTDAAGHNRVAEVSLQVRWVEDFCWHLRQRQGLAGPECTDCGQDLTVATHTAGLQGQL